MQPASNDPRYQPKNSAVIQRMRLHRLRWGALGASDLNNDSTRFRHLVKICEDESDVDSLLTYVDDLRWVIRNREQYDYPEIAWVFA